MPSRISKYSEFELTSYDSSVLDPNEIRERDDTKMAQRQGSKADAAVDAEIENMRAQIPAAVSSSNPSLELLRTIQRLEERMTRMENRNRETHQPEVGNYDANRTYGRTENDIRNRRSILSHYVPLKEARAMIPEFDRTSRHKLEDFLNARTQYKT